METLNDYDFTLPNELVATVAPTCRGNSRLLRLGKNDSSAIHDNFKNIGAYLGAGDILVVNNTLVMKARLQAFKKTGGRVEILLVRPLKTGNWAVLMNGRGPFLPGATLLLGEPQNFRELMVKQKLPDEPGLYEIATNVDLAEYARIHGKLPLPPYFGREATIEDETSYQTVFARPYEWGAVAAPTAGLHFTESLLEDLKNKGVKIVETTLHVGPGTFLPIRVTNVADHRMHSEWFSLSDESAHILNQAKQEQKRIIAVGTTALRVLEQVMQWAVQKGHNNFFPCEGSTALFIRPGFKFLGADGLITNFHLPRSTLIVLIAAVVGHMRALSCYEEAIKERYRFFSYGDACFFDMVETT